MEAEKCDRERDRENRIQANAARTHSAVDSGHPLQNAVHLFPELKGAEDSAVVLATCLCVKRFCLLTVNSELLVLSVILIPQTGWKHFTATQGDAQWSLCQEQLTVQGS